MMADQAVPEPVIHQPRVANGAGESVTAGAAQRKRRIAATIEEQQRLLTPLHRRADLLGQFWRNEPPARRRFAAQIDRLDLRHLLAAEALRQHHPLITVLARIHFAL